MRRPTQTMRVATVLAIALAALAGCAHDPAEPSARPTEAELKAAADTTPRLGTVGLVQQIKERGMSSRNWTSVIGGLFRGDMESDVLRTRYEVTIFYRDGTQGVVKVDEPPRLEPGQRVRVIGNRIEPLDP